MQPLTGRVFDAAWFARHQPALLWLLHAPVLGRWFRWVLCLRPGDVGYRGRILRLLPHGYIVANADGTRTLDARTHAKYGKRLATAFAWLWWTLHAWDTVLANPLVPALNAGFDTLTAYPDPDPETATVDGKVDHLFPDQAWSTLRTAAGTDANDLTTFDTLISIQSSNTADQWIRIGRSIVLFDTSAIGAGSVTAATLSIYGVDKADALAITPDIDIYTAAPASNTALVGTDYATLGSVSQTGAPISYASWSTTGYNDFTLNATGLGNIATGGVSKFGCRNANYDAGAVAPTWTTGQIISNIRGYFADRAGTVEDPKLVVTYTPPPRKRVRAGQNAVSAVTSFATAATATLAYPGAVTSGQLLTLAMTLGSTAGSVSTITDSVNTAGNWKRAISQRSTVAGSSLAAELWYAPNSSAGTPTVTVTMTSTMAGRFLFGIHSWTDASTVAADVLGTVGSTAGNSSNMVTPTLAGISSGSVVVATWKRLAGGTDRAAPVGWSTLAPQNSTRENSFYLLTTNSTTVSTKWQMTAAAQYVVALAEFRGSTFSPSTVATKYVNGLALVGVQ